MTKVRVRTESDSMGNISVPEDALYGAQTQRAMTNFQISNLRLPNNFMVALAQIKKAAAQANAELGLLSDEFSSAISLATDEIIAGKHADQFGVDVFQTGSGTSSNMNINEVISRLCLLRSGLEVHPNDHVNLGQSSNDVVPTAIQIASFHELNNRLIPASNALIDVAERKAKKLKLIIKTGRTHLMDAMPLSFGQELSGWASQLQLANRNIETCLASLTELPQGGTAVGTGVNTDQKFAEHFVLKLNRNSHMGPKFSFRVCENHFRALSSQDLMVGLSGHLRVLATALHKISTDLRWMNSGPLAGLAEIELEALQPGSSIMPGKVNPVIPEAVSMACAQVVGNDATIAMAGMSGNFQLNTMLPVIAFNILQTIMLLTNSAEHLGESIENFSVNLSNIEANLARNPILATALTPHIGYELAAKIAKKAYKTKQSILKVAREETDLDQTELQKILDPKNLCRLK